MGALNRNVPRNPGWGIKSDPMRDRERGVWMAEVATSPVNTPAGMERKT